VLGPSTDAPCAENSSLPTWYGNFSPWGWKYTSILAFISESVMIYWFFKTLQWRITLPGAVTLSLLANIFSFITAS
jgi:hypothetical protein